MMRHYGFFQFQMLPFNVVIGSRSKISIMIPYISRLKVAFCSSSQVASTYSINSNECVMLQNQMNLPEPQKRKYAKLNKELMHLTDQYDNGQRSLESFIGAVGFKM